MGESYFRIRFSRVIKEIIDDFRLKVFDAFFSDFDDDNALDAYLPVEPYLKNKEMEIYDDESPLSSDNFDAFIDMFEEFFFKETPGLPFRIEMRNSDEGADYLVEFDGNILRTTECFPDYGNCPKCGAILTKRKDDKMWFCPRCHINYKHDSHCLEYIKEKQITIKNKAPNRETDFKKLLSYSEKKGGLSIDGYCGHEECLIIPGAIDGKQIIEIGQSAIEKCETLKSVTIPEGVTKIEKNAFEKCINLKSVTIPESVTEIGEKAFYCVVLESVVISKKVRKIGKRAFAGCTSLERIEVEPDNPFYHSSNNCVVETSSKVLICGCKNSIIPSDGSVTSIGKFAFEDIFGSGSISMSIPESIESIGTEAFSGCYGLTSLTIPENVHTIGDWAFLGCFNTLVVHTPKGSCAADYCRIKGIKVDNNV